MPTCYLCRSKKFAEKNDQTRDNKNLKVVQCKVCSLTSLESFDHLSKVSYERGDMHQDKISNRSEYNQFLKSVYPDDYRRFKQLEKKIKNKVLLDFGSGAGGFLKLAENVAKKVAGVELDCITKYYPREIEVRKNINDFKNKFDVITLFHVLEHLPDPISFLKSIKSYLKPKGIIIVEVPNDEDVLISYYNLQSFRNFTYWSLHLYSYNRKTLGEICQRAGFKTKINFFQRYSLANHIGWLKDGQPGGQKKYKELDGANLNKCYKKQLEKINGCDTLIAVLRM